MGAFPPVSVPPHSCCAECALKQSYKALVSIGSERGHREPPGKYQPPITGVSPLTRPAHAIPHYKTLVSIGSERGHREPPGKYPPPITGVSPLTRPAHAIPRADLVSATLHMPSCMHDAAQPHGPSTRTAHTTRPKCATTTCTPAPSCKYTCTRPEPPT
ncbi:hypothetical protein EI94DRAFT_213267 [Lactarius quietus]|nr:hypothetical protein EI94DRAFT_213267 [Lactarius quietus]